MPFVANALGIRAEVVHEAVTGSSGFTSRQAYASYNGDWYFSGVEPSKKRRAFSIR
jgi:hypothetical protein